ncbi:hypothetical protein QUF86_20225 [Peribacillus sp. NJ11]|uniref:hypothetical protein n=1 Tax=Peribacillus sp. NJ11 TaxID=3055861 RepID=UPI0025A23C48|nr:hypothetical protein [Peribacillus sp. NJ11]MDM5223022.1 hypothetical protein [Peribacillus sp. NJ11]
MLKIIFTLIDKDNEKSRVTQEKYGDQWTEETLLEFAKQHALDYLEDENFIHLREVKWELVNVINEGQVTR